jgi:predicted kinase
VNKPVLILIRGLPGSGKTTFAKTFKAVHLEADMYFTDPQGNYKFVPLLLNEAHLWCQQQSAVHLKKGESVVVANTFVRQWELQPYRQLAKACKARLVIKVCTGNYANTHDVTQQTIDKMKKNWQA